MPLDELRKAVEGHAGIFHCRGRGDPSRVKDVAFHHEFGEPPATGVDLPLRSLADFYGTFAWLRLYRDPDSDDSAFYIGTPEEWAEFDEALRCWFEDLTPGERSGLLPPGSTTAWSSARSPGRAITCWCRCRDPGRATSSSLTMTASASTTWVTTWNSSSGGPCHRIPPRSGPWRPSSPSPGRAIPGGSGRSR